MYMLVYNLYLATLTIIAEHIPKLGYGLDYFLSNLTNKL